MRCLLRAVFAPAPASAGPARNGIWMKMRASTMSLRQLRTRAAVPFGHRIGAPFTNMLLFTSPSYHFKVLERKGSASARANVLRQNGDTFNYQFIGGQPPPKRNALWVKLYFCDLCVVFQCKLCPGIGIEIKTARRS